MNRQSGNPPLGYLLTWTTYGSWLPGDERGWVNRPGQFMEWSPALQTTTTARLSESALALDRDQRNQIEQTIEKHCTFRGWHLHAVNCRCQHVHVVVTANIVPEQVMNQFKSWCTRHLKELDQKRNALARQKWWTEGGSQRWIKDEDNLQQAIHYVRDCQ